MKRIAFIIASVLLIGCKENTPKTEFLGMVNLEVTGNSKAVSHFERGLLLLHSFEYQDAREAFRNARESDPEMPMAYWGEAMTYNHSLWHEQDYDDGVEVLKKLEGIDLEKNATELERDFIEAVKILFKPETEKTERDLSYAGFMEGLSKKYPDNHEVAAFYALSLLGSVPDGRDDELYGKGAKIALGILAENPEHPGALHYTIHSYDDPKHAALALEAANAYSKVAPDASHALHMPSHIYVAMGMWDRVIASNIDSYQASLNRMERKELGNDDRGYHAYHWLQYGYLQQDNKEEARKMVWDMQRYMKETPSSRARVHMVFLKGTYLTETDEWESDIADIPVEISDLNISVRSQYNFLEGMKAYTAKDTVEIDRIIAAMQADIDRETYVQEFSSASLCSNVTRAEAAPSDIVTSKARQQQLMALREDLAGRHDAAEEHLLKSIELQESVSYSYGPPSIQKPTRELYADWLVGMGRYKEAEAQYALAEKAGPKRRLIVEGIQNVSERLNDERS
jgi:tetratricopeptide (TPR) repeat protein